MSCSAYDSRAGVRSQVNFDHYTDCSLDLAVDLVNSAGSDSDVLSDVPALRDFLAAHNFSAPGRLTASVLAEVRALRQRLRAVWEARDAREAARLVNELLADSGALPQLTDHDGEAWHLHFTPFAAPLAVRLAAECAMGLASVMRVDGFQRLRTCSDERCDDVFVDTSRNRSRRYCDPDTCGNRAHVAAFRARRRAARG